MTKRELNNLALIQFFYEKLENRKTVFETVFYETWDKCSHLFIKGDGDIAYTKYKIIDTALNSDILFQSFYFHFLTSNRVRGFQVALLEDVVKFRHFFYFFLKRHSADMVTRIKRERYMVTTRIDNYDQAVEELFSSLKYIVEAENMEWVFEGLSYKIKK